MFRSINFCEKKMITIQTWFNLLFYSTFFARKNKFPLRDVLTLAFSVSGKSLSTFLTTWIWRNRYTTLNIPVASSASLDSCTQLRLFPPVAFLQSSHLALCPAYPMKKVTDKSLRLSWWVKFKALRLVRSVLALI